MRFYKHLNAVNNWVNVVLTAVMVLSFAAGSWLLGIAWAVILVVNVVTHRSTAERFTKLITQGAIWSRYPIWARSVLFVLLGFCLSSLTGSAIIGFIDGDLIDGFRSVALVVLLLIWAAEYYIEAKIVRMLEAAGMRNEVTR